MDLGYLPLVWVLTKIFSPLISQNMNEIKTVSIVIVSSVSCFHMKIVLFACTCIKGYNIWQHLEFGYLGYLSEHLLWRSILSFAQTIFTFLFIKMDSRSKMQYFIALLTAKTILINILSCKYIISSKVQQHL